MRQGEKQSMGSSKIDLRSHGNGDHILPNPGQPRLLSFTLDGWPTLGGQVSVSLPERVAVLVGRNGAGKSAILEGFEAISSWAIGRFSRIRLFDSESIPKILEVEILTPTERRLRYRYELIFLSAFTDDSDSDIDDATTDSSEENQFSWNESCQYLDGEKELLWETKTGVTTLSNWVLGDKQTITFFGNTNLFRQSHLPGNSQLKLPDETQWVYVLLKGVRLLGKAPVRQTSRRRPSLLQVVPGRGISRGLPGLADSLARKILRLKEI
jgi:hypothetical protein